MKKLHEYSLYIAERQVRKMVGVCCSQQEFDEKILKEINKAVARKKSRIELPFNGATFEAKIELMRPLRKVLEIKITPIRL